MMDWGAAVHLLLNALSFIGLVWGAVFAHEAREHENSAAYWLWMLSSIVCAFGIAGTIVWR